MRFRTSSQGNDRSVHWHQFSFLSGRTGRERKAGKFLMSSASDIAAAAAAVHGRPSLLQQVISCDDSVRWGAGAAHHIISLLHCSAYAPRARPGFQTTAMVVPAHACFSLSRGTSQAIAGSGTCRRWIDHIAPL
jgi:hypothetical protein